VRAVEFRLDGDTLCYQAQRRALTEADWSRFAEWIRQYHDVCWLPHIQAKLHDLGRQIHDWLDGPERWLGKLRETPDAPIIAEFAVRARPDEKARRFLEVPWELAADSAGHLAEQADVRWAPVRRVGTRADSPPPADNLRLGVMFMAASPRGETVLDYDNEELAILRATERTGLDLVVEDSGNLDELRVAWEDTKLGALHLSCHGLGGREPVLALEDDDGERDEVGLVRLANAFTARLPRLLFLSACHTGENDASVDSLALGLIGLGMPAVLAWADAVYDNDASAFAAAFYREAAHRATTIESAWALARAELLRAEQGREPTEHWHLARLFLGPRGGGALAVGRVARLTSHDAGRKGVVQARGGRIIEVASRLEFVGRRREIQTIQREFRHPQHAGVLIHGFGARVNRAWPRALWTDTLTSSGSSCTSGVTAQACLRRSEPKSARPPRSAIACATTSIRLAGATTRMHFITPCVSSSKGRVATRAPASRSCCCSTISRRFSIHRPRAGIGESRQMLPKHSLRSFAPSTTARTPAC
jgi:CHAT domain-containing protein